MTSDAVKIQVANGVVSLFGMIISGVIALLMAKLNRNALEAVAEVRGVKTDLVRTGTETTSKLAEAVVEVRKVKTDLAKSDAMRTSKLDEIAATGSVTHTLVNANMGEQLKMNAILSRRMADITRDRFDMEAADLSESKLAAHEEKQAVVDRSMDLLESARHGGPTP
jgi:hypothetical protein